MCYRDLVDCQLLSFVVSWCGLHVDMDGAKAKASVQGKQQDDIVACLSQMICEFGL